ncbi:MAG: DUF72 domain-containing protein [Dehalococcoidia bacterium]|nr:DUF72 domain-containing protein [Dehalococcoidia bacterium]
MGEILVGTCSWTDPTLIRSGRFYPAEAKTAEARLQFYASQFRLVEVDSSYYSLPSEATARLWATRTGPDFVFDVKAFRLFTMHPTTLQVLPKDIRESLPEELRHKTNIYQRDLPRPLTDELWLRFEKALLPLDSAGKLGVVLFQFPPWYYPGDAQRDYILSCKEKLMQYRIAVEFRHNSWVNDKNRDRTLTFLRENDVPFVCVDEPQGFKSSVPPLAEATSDIALVRFHGRNRDTWEKPGITTAERFNYLYTEDELREWVPRIKTLAGNTRQCHVLFNNCHEDKAVRNARQIRLMLE